MNGNRLLLKTMTFRGKINTVFIIFLIIVGSLTIFDWWSIATIQQKVRASEFFEDLFNNILEARRYEKNFLYYHDPRSLDENLVYINKAFDITSTVDADIERVTGTEYRRFQSDLTDYKTLIESFVSRKDDIVSDKQEESIRRKGKAIGDFAEKLLSLKRKRIHIALEGILGLNFVFLATFVMLSMLTAQLLFNSLTAESILEDYGTLSEADARELLSDVLSQAERASDIIKNLLDFSRSEMPSFSSLDIKEVILKSRHWFSRMGYHTVAATRIMKTFSQESFSLIIPIAATSKKTELKLTQVARASLEELKLDYEDFLRHRGLAELEPRHPVLVRFKTCQPKTLQEVQAWVAAEQNRIKNNTDRQGQARTNNDAHTNTSPHRHSPSLPVGESPCLSLSAACLAANAALSLLNLVCYLLDRQIERLALDFENEGGFSERLYRVRDTKRKARQ